MTTGKEREIIFVTQEDGDEKTFNISDSQVREYSQHWSRGLTEITFTIYFFGSDLKKISSMLNRHGNLKMMLSDSEAELQILGWELKHGFGEMLKLNIRAVEIPSSGRANARIAAIRVERLVELKKHEMNFSDRSAGFLKDRLTDAVRGFESGTSTQLDTIISKAFSDALETKEWLIHLAKDDVKRAKEHLKSQKAELKALIERED